VWSIDRFNARKGNKSTEARLRVPYESHSTADSKALLDIIDHHKLLAGETICDAIEGSWIGYANAMGLEYHEYKSSESCQILTLRDLRLALKQIGQRKGCSSRTGNVGGDPSSYSQRLRNGCIECKLLTEMKASHKTCVGQLYSQIFNKKK
jgi:hypothetical protein